MTLALVIFLSIWMIQASQAELSDKHRVSLQMKANPQRVGTRPDPFADSEVHDDGALVADADRIPAPQKSPSVEMNGVQVRPVSEPRLSDQYAGSAEIERMKEALASESTAREELQSKVDALMRKQSELQTALERGQETLSFTRQEKETLTEKLGESQSQLARLNSSTKELRSEAAEMKSSLKQVTSEFDSLRKRFESLQQQPREFSPLSLPETKIEVAATPPPKALPPPKQEEFLPPIKRDGSSGTPLAPPSEDAQAPLIEADPLFRESESMDCDYPPMLTGDSCTDTEESRTRGLLPVLIHKWKRNRAESCKVGSAEKSAPPRCTEAGTCEQAVRRPMGLFHRLGDLVRKDVSGETDAVQFDCSSECDCGCGHHTSRGLIPSVARWLEARQKHGCFEQCCCESN
ncbi:MAG TPA: hypothetical protein VMM56_10080 [Planctomycetaceae bacterium]|nr:hypothetical protein [Planctomycetaceae bacterium]